MSFQPSHKHLKDENKRLHSTIVMKTLWLLFIQNSLCLFFWTIKNAFKKYFLFVNLHQNFSSENFPSSQFCCSVTTLQCNVENLETSFKSIFWLSRSSYTLVEEFLKILNIYSNYSMQMKSPVPAKILKKNVFDENSIQCFQSTIGC